MPPQPKQSSKFEPPVRRSRILRRIVLGLFTIILVASAAVFADWWIAIPEDVRPRFVGGATCAKCHSEQHRLWQHSHHDLAMQLATHETVLADFNNASLEHHGITSRMFRRDDRFFVNTEGPEGRMQDFEVKYCFGVEPLQQYMVEFDRQKNTPNDAIARLQVLRISWDTQNKRWFYLPPPDAPGKLDPSDDLHWTGIAQRWNTMCADCHSTNLRKNFDSRSVEYATTFTDRNVNCEACHGPGSVHVQLATAASLFWDRRRGFGLPDLKNEKDIQPEVQTCATCHSRRRPLKEGFEGGAHFADHFELELPGSMTYFADGQILDEVYEYGSFLQSKMYHRSVRCSDCHDPHSAQLKHSGNHVCTSCHQHPAGRYDTASHHQHRPGSTGASCVECHMPATVYMEIDSRRDHSFRVPRPDLSVAHGLPNACTACHLDRLQVPDEKRVGIKQYRDWVLAARKDQQIAAALKAVDQWASDHVKQWYPGGAASSPALHPGQLLASAWEGDAHWDNMGELVRGPIYPGLFRATALQFGRQSPAALEAAKKCLRDPDPLVRSAAVEVFAQRIPAAAEMEQLAPGERHQYARRLRAELDPVFQQLDDPVRSVRISTAAVLVRIPLDLLPDVSTGAQRESLENGVNELLESWQLLDDRAAGHISKALIFENQERFQDAIDAYRTAIRVEPRSSGARSNLAMLLEQLASRAGQGAPRLRREAARLRKEELALIARDARLAPDVPDVQYRYAMALILDGQGRAALPVLQKAYELRPKEIQYVVALAMLHQELGNRSEAEKLAEDLVRLAPDDARFQLLLQEIRQQ